MVLMKIIFLFFISIVFSLNTSAQTSFSFSGLKWDDNVDQVDAQLTATGLQLSSTLLQKLIDKSICKIRNYCQVDFIGEVSGTIYFFSNKLYMVTINSDDNYNDRFAKLHQKYGYPLIPTIKDKTILSQNTVLWKSKYQETIELSGGGYIRYQSGASNQTKVDQKNKFEY